MKSFVALAFAASAVALPQSYSGSDCQDSRDGSFAISVVNVTDPSSSKLGVEKRQLSGILTLTLNGGVLKDQAGRDGYIASNHQFQFDQPVQDGALETSGFSVCSNGTLALGGNAVWYQCYTGGFYNLYDESLGEQCNQIYLYAQSSSDSPSSETGAVSQAPDGQPAASTQMSVPAVSQIPDGQPQAPSSQSSPDATSADPVVSQIPDGQPQAPTSQTTPEATSAAAPAPVISQISDGQPQAPTAAPAPTVSPTLAPEESTPAGAPISQISDGQPQAPVATGGSATLPFPVPSAPFVSQIPDGQPQAPNYTVPNATSPPIAEYTGAATTPMAAAGALAAGLVAMVAML